MKKWTAILLAAATLLTTAGCGGQTNQELPAVSETPPATDSQQTANQPKTTSSPVIAATATPEQETPRVLIAYFTAGRSWSWPEGRVYAPHDRIDPGQIFPPEPFRYIQ